MTQKITWLEGYNNHKKCTLTYSPDGKLERFHTELLDVELMGTTNIFEIFNEHLNTRQTKTVEVCYSGGLDSEIVLMSCVHNKTPVRAITLKIFRRGILLNTHDIYYSEMFCRNHSIEQKFVEVDVIDLYEANDYHGEYIELLKPYSIKTAASAIQLWLLNQCTGFVVIGGDYSWPWVIRPLLSPHRHGYNIYNMYMKDKGIHGIGNMLSHSADSNLLFIKAHLEVYNHTIHDPGDLLKLPYLKKAVFERAGFKNIIPRLKSYGLEAVPTTPVNRISTEMFGNNINSISWNNNINVLLGDNSGFNESK